MALAVTAFGCGCGHCVFVKRKLKGIFARVLLVIFCAAFLMATGSDTECEDVDTTFETTADTEETFEIAPEQLEPMSAATGSTATGALAQQSAAARWLDARCRP